MLIDALTNALAGMSSASANAAGAADVIADPNGSSQKSANPGGPRIGYLPLPGDPASAFVSLIEASLSFKANAAVLRTASRMVEALYKAAD